MKRFTTALLVALMMAMPSVAMAQTDTPTDERNRETVADQSTDQPTDQRTDRARDLEKAKAAVLRSIDVRIAALDAALVRVEGAAHLTAAHQATLTADYRFHRDELASLRGEVEAAETLLELAPLGKAVVEEHWIFALQIPKGRLTNAADVVAGVTVKAGRVSDELTQVLARLESNGINVEKGWELLEDFNAEVADAQQLAAPIPDIVLAIQVTQMPGAKSTLDSARADLRHAHGSLTEARSIARELVQFIRSVVDF
ncbi:MAG: hypothetical protein JJE47_04820 [Acidimicrobiia bacterium]|nr:hypothetical protein [Acidimicrobiia bacterium]